MTSYCDWRHFSQNVTECLTSMACPFWNLNLWEILTFLLFLRELGSVSVDDALLRGLRGTSWAEAEAKLEREAQLFQRWRWAAVVRRRCRSSLSRTTGLRTQGKHDRKLWVKIDEHGSVGWRLAGICPATPPQSATSFMRSSKIRWINMICV